MKKLTWTLLLSSLVGVLFAITVAFRGLDGEFRKDVISVGIVVSDMAIASDFYQSVIGMQEVSSFTLGGDFGKKAGITHGQSADVKMLRLGSSDNATNWKLISFDEHGTHTKNTYVSDDVGMQYITLYVHSLRPILKRISDHGIKLLGETPTPLDNGDHFVLIQDPDGTFIEIMGVL